MKVTDLFHKLFYGSTDKLLVQFVRYFFVGGFAFVVDFGLLYILTEYAGLHYLLSATLSFIAGLLVNYIISCLWVFNGSKFKNRLVEFLFFAAIGVVGLALNDTLIWLFTDCIGTHYMFSKIVAAAMVYLWNFFARKYLVFR
ncbi:GtrA family protein [Barnesiella viscericola]|uniref:GtrA family protein n=1 Tax=Barnesiella TaxID=397864 RepID=UPI000B370A95|nr:MULTISPECIES: GtrA family protein [Barnesiella]MCR8912230.1 GtrA family protein [Barnesiella sp. ET7]MDM8269184.1 GtrA family protein [Barnesiella viscericola]OUO98425.1 polysaccharide synthesis protein GtrA [Barnesiella sp. An22]HJB73427.1 GtrA family protein [Candidatus Barnesiella merdigallinarum]